MSLRMFIFLTASLALVLSAPLRAQVSTLSVAEQFFALKHSKSKNEKDSDGDGWPDRRDAFPYDRTEWLDTDRDGIGNNADRDDDNDGVADVDDAFPLDKTEWLDTDGDGIGNNTDPDDDNDGVTDREDAFPTDPTETVDADKDGVGANRDQFDQDAFCWRAEDADSNGCLLSQLNQLQRSQLASDGNNTLLIIDNSKQMLYRYALNSRTITLRQSIPELGPLQQSPYNYYQNNHLLYHKQHQKFYFLSADGLKLYQLAAQGNAATVHREWTNRAYNLHDAGNFLTVELAAYGSFSNGNSLVLNAAGSQVNQFSNLTVGNHSAFDPLQQRIFYFRDWLSPNDVHWSVFNQSTGLPGASLESPYHGDYLITGPIRVSPDGSRLLLGSGDVYNSNDLTWRTNLGGPHIDALFLANGESMRLRQQAVGEVVHSELIRQNAYGLILEQQRFTGRPLALLPAGQQVASLFVHNNQLQLRTDQPSDDRDGDGVPNLQDDFPDDPAAALDSDLDGAPDSWLPGKTAADSTTGLQLDAFIRDSACQRSDQATQAGHCDIAAQMPAQLNPDQIVSDNNGLIYLYSKADRRIYRWSSATQAYLNPLLLHTTFQATLQQPPRNIALHPLHQRIYLNYDNGKIGALSLSTGRESHFAGMATAGNIHAAGKFLIAQDNSGAWNTHYVYNANGLKVDQKDWKDPIGTLAWHAGLNRYFHTRPGTSPDDIEWGQLNQDGEIVAAGDSPYHGDHAIGNQLFLSADQQYLLSNSGHVYKAATLALDGAPLNITWFTTASWQPTLLLIGSNQTLSGYHSATRAAEFSLPMSGTIRHVAANSELATVVLQQDNTIRFYSLPLGDQDQDGLPDWWEQLHGFDNQTAADAQSDADNDGLTQLQEFTHRTNPRNPDSDDDGLTDGMEINTYRTSALNPDTDGDGLKDGEEVLSYQTNPQSRDSDNDGLSDLLEIRDYQTNPNHADTDGDGLADKWEVENGTDAKVADANADPDQDGLTNLQELQQKTLPTVADTDQDGLSDGVEVNTHKTDPLLADTDDDQLPDGWEVLHQLNPKLAADADADPDRDGFSNIEEYVYQSLPQDVLSRPQGFAWSHTLGDVGQRAVQPLKASELSMNLIWQQTHGLTGSVLPVIHSNNAVHILSSPTNSGSRLISFSDMGNPLLQRDLSIRTTKYGILNSELLVVNPDNYLRGYQLTDGELIRKTAISNVSSSDIGSDLLNIANGIYWSSDSSLSGFDPLQNALSSQHPLTVSQNAGPQYSIGDNRLSAKAQVIMARSYQYLVQQHLAPAGSKTAIALADCLHGNMPNHAYRNYIHFNGFYAQQGAANQVFTAGASCVAGYNTTNNSLLWQVNGNSGGQLAVLPTKVAAILHRSQLALMDSRSGSILKNWQAPNSKQIIYGPIATLSHVFVGTDTDTYALDLETLTLRWQYPVSGYLTLQPDHKLYVTNQQQVSVFALNTDTDKDGMPDWWERQYQLNANSAADAAADKDSDGLSNLAEYQAGSDPNLTDTDGDTLLDFAEVQTYRTHPAKADTDGDGLQDNVELQQHGTDPKQADTDRDGYHDGLEILIYHTDPLDAASRPSAWAKVTESFENLQLMAPGWILGGFYADTSEQQHGSQALRSPVIGDSETATLKLEQEFVSGTLSFYYKTDSEACCDRFELWVDGNLVRGEYSSTWKEFSHRLPQGRHSIEWRYRKDSSVSAGKDALFIDNVRFTAQ